MKIAALIVLYRPDIKTVVKLLQKIESSVDRVILIDNTESEMIAHSALSACVAKPWVNYAALGTNHGLAYAQNHGLGQLQQTDCDCVLFLDQDSRPCKGMIEALASAYRRLQSEGRLVAAIGPVIARDGSAPDSTGGIDEPRCEQTQTLMSSGMLVHRSVLDAVGYFDTTLFIDHVETEWLFRAQRHGFEVWQARHAHLDHVLGERTVSLRLHRRFEVAIHRPFRYFYQIRNLMWLLRRRAIPVKWGLVRLFKTLGVVLLCALIQAPRMSYVGSVGRGLYAGFIKGI